MSNPSNKRARSPGDADEEGVSKRRGAEGYNVETRDIGAGTEFEVLQAYRKFEEAMNQDRVQVARTGDIKIAMDSLDKVDALYKKVEGTKNNGLFAHDARAMVCISELAEISVRNLKFDDGKSLVNLHDIVNSLKKYMLKEYLASSGGSENLITSDAYTVSNSESPNGSPKEPKESAASHVEGDLEVSEVDRFKEGIIRRTHLQQFATYNEFDQFNWSRMGALFEHLSKMPQSVDHLLGPLSLTRKARSVINRRERETVGAAVTAEKVTQNSLSSVQEATTPEHVRRCFKVLLKKKGHEAINLYEFIIDPISFSKSVENLFYASFLVKEGRVVMEEDAQGFPCVRIKEELPRDPQEKAIEAQKRRDAQQNHIIFQLDMPSWRTFIDKFNIKVAFLE
ncbi:hypothetical protein HG535_0D01460 [Zygotorulaspora mrakii]|uniref:Non-structural maintenance of chromosomes element 4 n=1 Tax=Zygotorulaspora mrakii TaxID=42260 RepID=A0A7H9B1C5_ZYGMR|nr:uncharacterized protein HG535_0D01460 [Zygotorulaspora mrakii]QLG72438.1 hypothetical protein HG535_0D01460 [Zygotorulaspora mrakii]